MRIGITNIGLGSSRVRQPYGPNLIVNGQFTTDTSSWIGDSSTLAVVSGELEVTGAGATARARQVLIPTVSGRTYRMDAIARRGTSTATLIAVYNTADNVLLNTVNVTTTGTLPYTFDFTATGTTVYIWLRVGVGTGYFDDVQIRLVN
jgi:hypothetical protein